MTVFDDDDRGRFGPYRVIRRIGSGGMGSIFEAEDMGLGHRVASKLLHPHVAERPGAARRFLREGRAAARIRHPHVVQVFALGTEGSTPYLAMELLDRGNVSDLIAGKGRLPVSDTLDVVLPVIAAVAAAHHAGVIHRDLKPSNVCLAQGPLGKPWPKVVDFGVSKVVAAMGMKEATITETVIGTAAYMAPEQARAASNASFLSDQYSLAVLLYQCVTGGLPFAGRSTYEVLEAVMSAPLAPPSTRARGVPEALDETLLRAMSRDPRDRFVSVREFGTALLPIATERTRLALEAELSERRSLEPDLAAARDVGASGLGPDSDPSLGETMLPGTGSRDTRAAGRRLKGAMVAGVVALAGLLVLVANLALHPRVDDKRGSVVAHAVATLGAAATASASALDPPTEMRASAGQQEGAYRVGQAAPSSAPSVTAAPSRRKAPRRRSAPPATPSAWPLSVGDNGAFILP